MLDLKFNCSFARFCRYTNTVLEKEADEIDEIHCCLFDACQDGCTALMFAAMSGHGPIVTELMKAHEGAVQWTRGEMDVMWRMGVRPMLQCMVRDTHQNTFILKRLLFAI